MAKTRSVFICSECGTQQPRWLGRCPGCQSWETLVEEASGGGGEHPRGARAGEAAKLQSLGEIDPAATPRQETGIGELDRVLGGGLVPGSVILLGGEPGIGKSTLSLQLAAGLTAGGTGVLYVSGEESPEQIRLRADRLTVSAGGVGVLPSTRAEEVIATWREQRPGLVLVDSIQTQRCEAIESAAGSVAQVRECAAMLAEQAKSTHTALILIGHVTKEGVLAGPRVLEHMVDVVLHFEGDRHHAYRVLRSSKNRFGSTEEIGVFSMGASGVEEVDNPSELFLAERHGGNPGSCVVPLLEGSRPILVEIQALVAPAPYGTPRRTCIGVEDGRVALLLAVLDRRSDIDLLSRDVYVNAAGGVRVNEPGADLGLALAIASSRLDVAIPADVAACGEIGLGGEVRRVARVDLRVREAARLGYRRVLVPPGGLEASPPDGCRVLETPDIAAAVSSLRGWSNGEP